MPQVKCGNLGCKYNSGIEQVGYCTKPRIILISTPGSFYRRCTYYRRKASRVEKKGR